MKTKNAAQRIELQAAVEDLTRALRRIRNAGEPNLALKVGGVLKDVRLAQVESVLAQ